MSSTGGWAIAVGTLLGFGIWTLISLAPILRGPRLANRIAPYLVDVSAEARAHIEPRSADPLPVVGMLFAPLGVRARRAFADLLGGRASIARRLRQAGSPLTVEAFRSQQLLWGLAGLAGGILAAVAVVRAQPVPAVVPVAVVVVFAVLGVVARETLLTRAAKGRQTRMAEELPVVLEFLTLSLSAGEGVLDAIRRIARISGGELSAELASVVTAVNTGLPLADTLNALAADLELPAFTRCVDQMVGALERGTPLAEVLRAQAQDARDDMKRDLLELAGKKEVGMLIPLVFLILPVTIAFAIFPGIFVLQVGL
jgi:tight adherence protein C